MFHQITFPESNAPNYASFSSVAVGSALWLPFHNQLASCGADIINLCRTAGNILCVVVGVERASPIEDGN